MPPLSNREVYNTQGALRPHFKRVLIRPENGRPGPIIEIRRVVDVEWDFRGGAVPTAIVEFDDPTNAIDLHSQLRREITIEVGFAAGLMEPVFTGKVFDYEENQKTKKLLCSGASNALDAQFRQINATVNNTTAAALVTSFLQASGVPGYSVAITAWPLGTVELSDDPDRAHPVITFATYGEGITRVVEPDGGVWWETPTGITRVRDVYVLDAMIGAQAQQTYSDVSGRLFGWSDQPAVRETKNQAIVKGATIPQVEDDGSIDSIDVDGRANAPSDLVLKADGTQAYNDVLLTSELIESLLKAGQVAGRIVDYEDGLHRHIQATVAGDPSLSLFQNLRITDARRGYDSGVAALVGYHGQANDAGFKCDLDLLFADSQGGANIFPFALFRWLVDREVMGDGVKVTLWLDGRSASDPDGSIVAWRWSSNQSPDPLAGVTGQEAFARLVPDDIVGTLEVTLEVEDDQGATDSITLPIHIAPFESGVVVPNMWVALEQWMSYSLDGGVNWVDIAEQLAAGADIISSCGVPPISSAVLTYGISLGLFGARGGRIFQLMNGVIFSTVDIDPPSPIVDVRFDMKDYDVCWALTEDGRVYRSDNAGLGFSWALWDDLRTVFGVATYRLTSIATPLAGGLWIYGGAGGPLIAVDPNKDHRWVDWRLGGELATDLEAASGVGAVAGTFASILRTALQTGPDPFNDYAVRVLDGAGWAPREQIPRAFGGPGTLLFQVTNHDGTLLRLREVEMDSVHGVSTHVNMTALQLERSVDGGFTWTQVGPAPTVVSDTVAAPGSGSYGELAYGVSQYYWGGDGSVWLIYQNQDQNVARLTRNAAGGTKFYRSADGAQTFTLMYTDAGYVVSGVTTISSAAGICSSDDGTEVYVQGSYFVISGFGARPNAIYNWYSGDGGGSFARRAQAAVTNRQAFSENEELRCNMLSMLPSGRVIAGIERNVSGSVFGSNTNYSYTDDHGLSFTDVLIDAESQYPDSLINFMLTFPYMRKADWGARLLAIMVTTAGGVFGGAPAIRIYRSEDEGDTWEIMPNLPASGLGGFWLLFDYDAPNDRAAIGFYGGVEMPGVSIENVFGPNPIFRVFTPDVALEEQTQTGCIIGEFGSFPNAFVAAAASREVGELALLLDSNGGALPATLYYSEHINPAHDGADFGRALGQPSHQHGKWMDPDSIPGQFSLGWDNEEIWNADAFGGVLTATQTGVSMDSGDYGRHSVWFGAMLGGIGWGGLHIIAGGGALYKTFDRFATLDKLRPALGFDPMPAAAVAWHIGLSAPNGDVTGGSDGGGGPAPDPGHPPPPPPPIPVPDPPAPTGTRNKFTWPFSSDSIWNMPIGSEAVYVPAQITARPWVAYDPEYIIPERSTYPSVDLWLNGHFSPDRCDETGTLVRQVQIDPALDIQDTTPGFQPNNCGAVILLDGRTIEHYNPVTRCLPQTSLTVGFDGYGTTDIYQTGEKGSHGGSSLSAIGGSIRRGELTSSDPIRHAIKILLSQRFLSQQFGGFRWPAYNADAGFDTPFDVRAYTGAVPALRMGSLLAIHPDDLTTLNQTLLTAPARKLLWTLCNYGGYVVDTALETDPAYGFHMFCMEDGVPAEVNAAYGYDPYIQGSGASGDALDYFNDINLIFENLYVVNNNIPTRVGGGGQPRQPLAPPIGD